VACMFFAAISGSGPATVAAIGGFMIPAMIKNKYDEGFAAAVPAAAGSIGVIIPPSIPFVLYGVIGSVSVGDMFLAGIVPGILIGLSLMLVAYLISKRKNYKPSERESFVFKDVLKAVNNAKWALMIPVIILGGIYGGIFSPTEAAVVAVVYAIIIGVFVYKELNLKELYDSFLEAVIINVTTMIIIGLSVSFAHFMTLEKIPNSIAEFMTNFSTDAFVVLFMINLLLLFVVMFMYIISALVVLSPNILAVATTLVVDPVHFVVILVANLAVGFVTPPLGVNLFVATSVGRVRFEKITIAVIPFVATMILCIILITFFPQISLWLPNLFD